MLTRLRLINFRSHADTSIDLHPISLFIGPVASGKSNVFKGLLLLQNSVHQSLDELFPRDSTGDFQAVRSRWTGEAAPIGFEAEVRLPFGSPPEDRARYTVQFADSDRGPYVLEETLQTRAGEEEWEWRFRRGSPERPLRDLGDADPQELDSRARLWFGDMDPHEPTILNRVWRDDPRVQRSLEGPQIAKEVARELSRIAFHHLEASALKAPGAGEFRDRIGYDGRGLPDFIARIKSSSQTSSLYEAIREDMREILPELRDIAITRLKPGEQQLAMSLAGYRGLLAAPELSDGTMFTLGLSASMRGLETVSLLCIEEPETGLHPGRLRWLFDRLMDLAYPPRSKLHCQVQVMLSTHSPYLVDCFGDMQQCVQVVDQSEGRTCVRALTAIQETILHLTPEAGEPIGHLWASGLYERL